MLCEVAGSHHEVLCQPWGRSFSESLCGGVGVGEKCQYPEKSCPARENQGVSARNDVCILCASTPLPF